MNDAQTLTEAPTTTAAQDAAKTALESINQLKALAEETLSREFHAIAGAAGRDDDRSVDLRLRRKSSLDELVGGAAWLARDLVDVLLKVATESEPTAVMGSDIPSRIRKAETRLELFREMIRSRSSWSPSLGGWPGALRGIGAASRFGKSRL